MDNDTNDSICEDPEASDPLRQRTHDAVLVLTLVLLVILSYGIHASRLGYYWDDWTRIAIAATKGLTGLRSVVVRERPFLGFYINGTIGALGFHPTAWHIANCFVRVGGVLAAYLLLRSLYGRRLASAGALLFAVFPAFTFHAIAATFLLAASVINLAFLSSLWLMILSLRSKCLWRKALLSTGALVGAVVHLTICEYYFAAELVRPLVLWQCLRSAHPRTKTRLRKVLFTWFPYLLVQAAIVGHRLLFFQGRHKPFALFTSTRQLGRVGLLAFQQLYQWFLSSWLPDPEVLFDPSDRLALLMSLGLATAFGLLTYLVLPRRSEPRGFREQNKPPLGPALHGFLYAVLSGTPIWLAYAITPGLHLKSLYALVPAIGVVVALAAVIYRFSSRDKLARGFVAALVALGFCAQLQTTADFATQWQQQRSLWDQVRARCPHIETGTTLVIAAPEFKYFAIMPQQLAHPANLAYHAGSDRPSLTAVPLSTTSWRWPNDTHPEVLLRAGETFERWSEGFVSNGKALVFYYDRASGILYTPNKELPILPSSAPFYVRFWAERSDTSVITKERITKDLIEELGIWQARTSGWASYYQRIELMRQFGEWQRVIALFEESQAQNVKPIHLVDYLPVLDAYLHLNRKEETIKLLEPIAEAGPYQRSLLRHLLELRRRAVPLADALLARLERGGTSRTRENGRDG